VAAVGPGSCGRPGCLDAAPIASLLGAGIAVFRVVFSHNGPDSLPLTSLATHQPQLRISVQGGVGGWRPGQGLGLSVLFGAPVMLLSTGCAPLARRYWLGLVARCRCWYSHLYIAAAGTHLHKFEPLSKDHSALVTKLEEVVPALEPTFARAYVPDEGQPENQRPERYVSAWAPLSASSFGHDRRSHLG